MTKRLPPLFESGTYGCPYCGSPDIEFRDFQTLDRSFAVAGKCEGWGNGTRHRWVSTFTPTNEGMSVRVALLHEDVNFPGRLPQPVPPTSSAPLSSTRYPDHTALERQLEASLRQLGIDPTKYMTPRTLTETIYGVQDVDAETKQLKEELDRRIREKMVKALDLNAILRDPNKDTT